MKEPEQIGLIRLLKKTYDSFKKQDVKSLRSISDSVTKEASIMQDDYIISLAIIIYSLSKILEKEKYQSYAQWNSFYKNTLKDLKKLLVLLSKSDFDGYSSTLKDLLSQIKTIDLKASTYIEELVNSSRIKKGSNLYAYGLSLGRAAELLGISKWELMNYVGNLDITNEGAKIINIRERYNTAKKVFNIK